MIRGYRLQDKVKVLLSPVQEKLDPAEIAHWILQDGLNVRLHLQLHKVLWPDKSRNI